MYFGFLSLSHSLEASQTNKQTTIVLTPKEPHTPTLVFLWFDVLVVCLSLLLLFVVVVV